MGIQEVVIHQGFLTSCPCDNCGETEENKITVLCKVFTLGRVFLTPLKWVAWDRRAYVICNSCKKESSLDELTGPVKVKADKVFNEKKIPLSYFLMFFVLIIVLFKMWV